MRLSVLRDGRALFFAVEVHAAGRENDRVSHKLGFSFFSAGVSMVLGAWWSPLTGDRTNGISSVKTTPVIQLFS